MKYIYITIIILSFPFLNTFSQWSKFECDGSGKCLGIEFSIKYPSNWKRIDGDHPHIVNKFEFVDKLGFGQMIVYLSKLEESPTKSDIEKIYSKENVTNSLNSIGNVIKVIEFNNQAIIEDERCAYATIQIEGKIYDQIVRSIIKTNILLWKDYLFQFNFAIISNDQSFETMTKMYNDYNELFREIMISLVINSKWEK